MNDIIYEIKYPQCKPLLRCFRTWFSIPQDEEEVKEYCIKMILMARYYWIEAREHLYEYCEESQEKKDWMSFNDFRNLKRKDFFKN